MTRPCFRLAFTLPLLCLAFGAACGDEDEAEQPVAPEGCYIEANRRCDCELAEAACTEDVGTWTDGCDSCR